MKQVIEKITCDDCGHDVKLPNYTHIGEFDLCFICIRKRIMHSHP